MYPRCPAGNQILHLTEPMENESKYTCADYREEMAILGLRRRLRDENITEEQKRAIIEEIKRLEAVMQID